MRAATFDVGVDVDVERRLVEPDDAQQPHPFDERQPAQVALDVVDGGSVVDDVLLRFVVGESDVPSFFAMALLQLMSK